MNWFRRIVPQGIKNAYHFFQAAVAALLYRFPSRSLKIIGVTGTDGKTTTVNLIYHILKSAGIKVSMISTVKAMIGEATFDTGFHVTTPSPFEVQKYLRMMLKAGSEVGILEVTSHGLDQNRVKFVDFYEAVITNITPEHLDYHKSYQSYVKAKSKILEGVKYRILNADDKSFDKLRSVGSGKMTSFGIENKADVSAINIKTKLAGTEFDLKFEDRREKNINVSSPLIGDFNIYNIIASVVVAKTFNVENEVIKDSLKKFPGVVGRMEMVDEGQNFNVVIDFAHTPNSLEHSLRILRKTTKNKLICLFGSAGERDVNKRPLMGEIAGNICDHLVITGEDPRHEDVNKIIDEIAQGTKKAGGVLNQTYWKIPDRAEAIREAIITLADEKDTVVILGKGHEKSMNIAGVEYPWSDQISARNALSERFKK